MVFVEAQTPTGGFSNWTLKLRTHFPVYFPGVQTEGMQLALILPRDIRGSGKLIVEKNPKTSGKWRNETKQLHSLRTPRGIKSRKVCAMSQGLNKNSACFLSVKCI